MTAEDVAEYLTNVGMPMLLNGAQGLIDAHNIDPDAHPLIRTDLETTMARIGRLEDMFLNDITANPFLITFGNLNGVIVSGVWNQIQQRIEF
jgi:hypothetical protein